MDRDHDEVRAQEVFDRDCIIGPFVDRYLHDRDRGRLLSAGEYCALFPGYEDIIAREFRQLCEAGGEKAGDGGNAAPGSGESPWTLGRYRILAEIGRGGQGVVYLAEDTQLQRRVALKVLERIGTNAGSLLERFRREALVTSRLDHPGICPVHDAGVEGHVPYIAMRYIEGQPLSRKIDAASDAEARDVSTFISDSEDSRSFAERPSTEASADVGEVLEFVEKAARALHAVHQQGVVHRDMKPGNIMVTPAGDPVLLDFGLARMMDGSAQTLTKTGDVFGTPAYMAPEQIRAEHLDARADVYSLGVTLFESLTLRRPFNAPTREALYRGILEGDHPNPRELNPAIADDLAIVVETALRVDLGGRYQSAENLADELRRVRLHEPIQARPVTRWIKTKRWSQRNPGVAIASAVAIVSLTVGLAVSLLALSRERSALLKTITALDAKDAALAKYAQMSDVARIERLIEEQKKLWPRRRSVVASMVTWLDDAREVFGHLDDHVLARDELRALAPPLDDEALQAQERLRSELFPEVTKAVEELEQTIARRSARADELAAQLEDLSTAPLGTAPESADSTRRAIERVTRRREATLRGLALAREDLLVLQSDPQVSERLIYELADPTDSWRLEVLTKLVSELSGGEQSLSQLLKEMEARVEYARSVDEKTIAEHRAAWDLCIANVALRDGHYSAWEGPPFSELAGLVPLGRDADSGLWEFWHSGSGGRPDWTWTDEPAALGRVGMNDDSGLVMVLLPGGRFRMGADKGPLGEPHRDPNARRDDSPVHDVTLGAFLMSKYEMTQGQWQRLMKANPSKYAAGSMVGGKAVTLRNPVTNVDWFECGEVAHRLGLQLPSEAQWEYACRAGTTSVYWCGDDLASVQRTAAGNLGDQAFRRFEGNTRESPLSDGFACHAPVGTFSANIFGLHDVLGNVEEWCRDRCVSYRVEPRPGDGLRDDPRSLRRERVFRGGSWAGPPIGRSAFRGRVPPTYRQDNHGFRPALSLGGQ